MAGAACLSVPLATPVTDPRLTYVFNEEFRRMLSAIAIRDIQKEEDERFFKAIRAIV